MPRKVALLNQASPLKAASPNRASPWKVALVNWGAIKDGWLSASCGAAASIWSRSAWVIGTPRASITPVSLSRCPTTPTSHHPTPSPEIGRRPLLLNAPGSHCWSFSRSFHRPQLQPTRPHWPESGHNLTWLDHTGAVCAQDGQLSPKQRNGQLGRVPLVRGGAPVGYLSLWRWCSRHRGGRPTASAFPEARHSTRAGQPECVVRWSGFDRSDRVTLRQLMGQQETAH